jgi:subtilase family serine protease
MVNTVTAFYWSTDSTYDAADVKIGQRTVDPLAPGVTSGPASTSVTISTTAVVGTYYIIAVADEANAVTEASEVNNTRYITVKTRRPKK